MARNSIVDYDSPAVGKWVVPLSIYRPSSTKLFSLVPPLRRPFPHEAGEACAHSGRFPARPLLRFCPYLQPERQPCVCALQDVPPPGGYPAVRTARNLPKGGASAMVMALGSAFIYTWGMYKIIKANQTRRCRAPPPWRCAGGLCSPPELCGARRQGVEA